jgi:putative oxidoreductase
MNAIVDIVARVFGKLDGLGDWLGMLPLRLLLAWEFWESGVEKYTGENWFGQIQDSFPFPFSVVPATVSWFVSTWAELLGAVALVIGLGTRFTALTLIILDLVAWYSVHAGNGYNVCSNGYKLPMMYLMMLMPLLLMGPGRASLDALIRQWMR